MIEDPGEPLGEADFILASQLPIIPLNEEMMIAMAEGEIKGQHYLTDDAKDTRFGLAAKM